MIIGRLLDRNDDLNCCLQDKALIDQIEVGLSSSTSLSAEQRNIGRDLDGLTSSLEAQRRSCANTRPSAHNGRIREQR